MAPARTCSSRAAGRLAFPLPRKPRFMGKSSAAWSMRWIFQGPGVHVVALVPAAGPVPLGSIAGNIQAGSFAEFKGSNAVIIGARMATKMGLAIGDKITLISPKGNATAFGTVPRMKAYRVVATFQIGMYEYDSNFVFMPLSAAQIYFKLPGAVSNLEVFIADPDNASAVAGRMNTETAAKVLDLLTRNVEHRPDQHDRRREIVDRARCRDAGHSP